MTKWNGTVIIGRIADNPTTEDDGSARFRMLNNTEEGMVHEIEAIGEQARICRENLNAGDLCCIEGHLYGEIGARRIIADRVTLLSRLRGDTIAQKKQDWEIGIRRGGEYRVAQG